MFKMSALFSKISLEGRELKVSCETKVHGFMRFWFFNFLTVWFYGFLWLFGWSLCLVYYFQFSTFGSWHQYIQYMCVCACIYIYIYYIYIYIYIYICVCVWVYSYIWVGICIYIAIFIVDDYFISCKPTINK